MERAEIVGEGYQKMQGLRLLDGLDMGVHPQDLIDHAGTPLGDELELIQLNVNVGTAIARMYEEMNKSWWQRLLDLFR